MGKRLIGSVGLAPGSDEGTDLTTKGDIHGYSTTNTRIPVGTNNFSILADSSQALGLKWGASATSILSASGDILYASGANTLARLAKGDNDQVLTLKSGIPSWETSSGGLTITTTTTTLGSANFTTTNTTFTAVTNLSVTVQNSAGGTAICSFTGTGYNESSSNDMYWAIMDDGSTIASSPKALMEPSKPQFIGSYCFQSTDGSVVQVYVKTTSGGTANFYGNNANYESSLHVIEWV